MRSPIPPTELSIKKSPTQKNLFLVPSKYLFLLVPREDKKSTPHQEISLSPPLLPTCTQTLRDKRKIIFHAFFLLPKRKREERGSEALFAHLHSMPLIHRVPSCGQGGGKGEGEYTPTPGRQKSDPPKPNNLFTTVPPSK